MSFISNTKTRELAQHLETSLDELKKIHRRSKSTKYISKSVDTNRLGEYTQTGWEIEREFTSRVRVRREKKFDKQFEDDIWSLFFRLGFDIFSIDSDFHLPWDADNENETKQVDVLAADSKRKIIFLIECKSAAQSGTKKDFKNEIDHLREKVQGFTKSVREVFGYLYNQFPDKFSEEFNPKLWKVKHIFATRNIRIPENSTDSERLKNANSFHLDENAYNYVNNLIEKYKEASIYQFLPLIFKGTKINDEKIEIPAVKSKMGGLDYYIFSIEPKFLLQIGYVLHRVKANIDQFPTYQRLLVPSRLKGIREFLSDAKGFFPNSILINFSTENNKLLFEPGKNIPNSLSQAGVLKIPNVYAMAYIIDGQHRVYGYTGIEFDTRQSIPVVAFSNLESMQQLKIFMEINENQKKVSADLRNDLVQDLYWDAKYPSLRMEALSSHITKIIGNSQRSILYNKISVGEDKESLEFTPFMNGLKKSGLLPILRSRHFDREKSFSAIYDFNLDDKSTNKAMKKAGFEVSELIINALALLEKKFPALATFTDKTHMILSPRGIEAIILAIGAINTFIHNKKRVNNLSSVEVRLEAMKDYLIAIFDGVDQLSEEYREKLQNSYGARGAKERYCYFLSLANKVYPDLANDDLREWSEMQNESIQDEGRRLGEKLEYYIKEKTIKNLISIYGEEEWEWNIGELRKKCMERHDVETRKNKKEGDNRLLKWWDYFDLTDYKKIMEMRGMWGKTPEIEEDSDFQTFAQLFSRDLDNVDHKPNKPTDGLKWFNLLIKYRNVWSHSGTKRRRINAAELETIKKISELFNIN